MKAPATAEQARRYGFAFVTSWAALLLTLSIPPLKAYFAFDSFQGAVFLSAWYGGFGPGALAIVFSILTMDFFLMPPFFAFSVSGADMVRLAAFGIVGLVMSSLSARLRDARRRLQAAHDDLERRLGERTEEVLTISNREQQRIGQDLHDGLCQTLAGARLLTEALRTKLSAGDIPRAGDLEKIESRLGEVQAQAETVSRGLYPVELETDGLTSALRDLADRISSAYPVACRFTCRGPFLVHDHGTALHLYRIVHEGVMNAIKGGKAHGVEIRLLAFGARRHLAVADDGAGIPAHPARKGMGMKIMEYRARAVGASLKIRPRRSGGTLLVCSFHTPATQGGDA